MLKALANSFKISDLKKRIVFTLVLIIVFRVGAFIPTPGIDAVALSEYFKRMQGTILGFLNLFSGGAFENFSILALGIMPYISASIIIQLLTVVIPYLEKLSKEGEVGRKKITQYTRCSTVLLSLIQSAGLSFWMQSIQASDGSSIVYQPGIFFHLTTMITLTTGTVFLMWLGEQITERGIGNGISLLIFAGIVANVPGDIANTIKLLYTGEIKILAILFVLILIALVTAAVIIMLLGQRRVTVQYAKRIVGRKVYGGQSTHIPLLVNQAGVIPVIFASSILAFPSTLATFLGRDNAIINNILSYLGQGGFLYSLIYVASIIFFTYFYTAVIFNPNDVAENMRKHGGFVPGIRPGKPTANYIDNILSRITLVGAIFLALIALLPDLLINWVKVPFYFGGTALLIVVGVNLDTIKQIESHLLMRNYEGFMKKGKLRGRR
ncbi:preprotein translocase subunit SecY [bacterium]|nr:preprotein translocase subunit SecY [bacterium]MBU0899791.1 preprotein translocase subunit SecY [bacterium]MBU1153611.1 preprotein translocase subunit SecY [bacterium]MBU1782608.1 preprotein translocase subunit SecY [bacterium]MBU2600248.1 preprotein translocase subunit SecY [bacterium]